MKAKQIVFIGGILNTLMSLFHIFLIYQIYVFNYGKPYYPLLQLFAIGGCIMIIFLAYTSLLYSDEMVTSKLGKTVIALNILIYLSRAIGEITLTTAPRPIIIVVCLILVVLYLSACVIDKRTSLEKK